ncbi:MAG: C39 family peptidase [Myxococcales bacterium]|nr:C39 family peptidase [Myxococcales bacterium]
MTALLALALLAPPAVAIEGVPYVEQGRSPWCAAAVMAMLAGHQGAPIALPELVRAVPVEADGISWPALADALAERGLTTFIVVADEAALRATLAAGLPVAVAERVGVAKHAIVVTGYDAAGYAVLDPAAPGRRRLAPDELRANWAGGQMIVVAQKPPAALPTADWKRQTSRFRALEWGLRAERTGRHDAQTLALYDLAVAEDPNVAELQNNRALTLAALNRREEACAAFARAAALAPDWPVPRQNRAALKCL